MVKSITLDQLTIMVRWKPSGSAGSVKEMIRGRKAKMLEVAGVGLVVSERRLFHAPQLVHLRSFLSIFVMTNRAQSTKSAITDNSKLL